MNKFGFTFVMQQFSVYFMTGPLSLALNCIVEYFFAIMSSCSAWTFQCPFETC